MLVNLLPILLTFITLFSSLSTASPLDDSLEIRGTPTSGQISNAERMARRLPLSKPKRLFNAARPRVALAPRASCMPIAGEFKVEVYYASDLNTRIGFLTGNGFDQGALTTDINSAPTFSSPCAFDADNQVLSSDFKLQGTTPYPYFMVRSPSGGDLGNGAGASAFGFNPDPIGDSGAQTTAFRVDSTTAELTVTYTNTDSTTGQPNIYNYQGTFFASRSAADIQAAYSLDVTEEDKVVFEFVQQAP